MESDRSQQPPVEVLDSGRPPSAFSQWLDSLLEHRGVKAAGAVVVAALLLFGWQLASDDQPEAGVADDPAVPVEPLPPVPQPEERPVNTGPWKIGDDLSISFSSDGRLISFTAMNRGRVPQDPRALQVEADYPGGLASSYAFGCVGGKPTADGFEQLDRLVAPGERVLVRCPDTVRLNGAPGRLPPEELNVVLRAGQTLDQRGT